MSTVYPSQIDTTITLISAIDNSTPVQAVAVNQLRDAILAIETELGVKPSGIYGTVRTRLDNLDTLITSILSGGGFSGDLSGGLNGQIVIGLQGRPISNTAPAVNQTYIWSGSQWVPGNVSSFTAGGDLSGNNVSQTVIKINGAAVPISGSLTTGNVLQVSGTSALSYGPVNLGGGSNFVSGVLPTANQASQSLGGDLSGTTNAATVNKINAATVPAAGALTTGNVLQVSGSSALSYSSINLAGGSNFVSGILPVKNGGAPWQTLYVNAFGVVTNTNASTYVNGGNFEIDITKLQSAGTGTRTIKLKLLAETTGPQANFQLFNLTTSSVVSGSSLTTTSTTPVALSTGDLTSALTNGNASYQVQMFMTSGGGSADRIVLDNARLQIDWS